MENINKTIQEYFEALNRLVSNEPINIPIGSKINKDTVALEAGRKRGSIKKSREVFTELIEAIEKASKHQNAPQKEAEQKLNKLRADKERYKQLYLEALNRELMLIEKINILEKQLKKRSLDFSNNELYKS